MIEEKEKIVHMVEMPEALFREVHAVLAQIPYGQIAQLMNKLAIEVRLVREEDDEDSDGKE